MKKLTLMFLLGFAFYPAAYEFADHLDYTGKVKLNIPYRFEYGIMKPFNKFCTKDASKNGHGWVFIRRDYYNCGPISIFVSDTLYGEYTRPRNLELEKEACKKCKM